MPSYIATVLAERSPAELESIRDKARVELNRITVELEQVEEALTLQQRATKGRPQATKQPRAKSGSSRERILKIVTASSGPMSPSQIRDAIAAEGGRQFAGGSLYAMIKRLTEEGALHKVSDGLYMLPSPDDDSSPHGPTENGTGARLSTGPLVPQEG